MREMQSILLAVIAVMAPGCRGDGPQIADSGDADTADMGLNGDTDTPRLYPRGCVDLYDNSVVPTFEVEMDASEWSAMLEDCENTIQQYRPVLFRYGGESLEAMMRLKGNWSWNCDKMQFVISFNETNKEGRFHGLRKIVLDAPWYDHTVLHERMAFFFFERLGLPYSCVNNALLYINGEYYGVYANVERLDREYLERHFSEPDGNLYKEGRELKTNEETGDTGRMEAFWSASDIAAIDALVELEQAVDVWAGLAMAPDPDSYWAGVEINFYLYDHPSRGFLYLPYDMDMAFAEDWPAIIIADPILYEHESWRREAHCQLVLSESSWCRRFIASLGRARSAYDVSLFESKLDEWSAQIADAVDHDPHKTFTFEEHLTAIEDMRRFFGRRAEFIDDWLDTPNHCPPSWPERRLERTDQSR